MIVRATRGWSSPSLWLLAAAMAILSGCGASNQDGGSGEGFGTSLEGPRPTDGDVSSQVVPPPLVEGPRLDEIVLPGLAIGGQGAAIWLQTEDGGDEIFLSPGQRAVVQLWLQVESDVVLAGMDAILRGFDADLGKNLAIQIVRIRQFAIPESVMQPTHVAPVGTPIPPDGYQYIADTEGPYDTPIGLVGPRTVLLSEITIQASQPPGGQTTVTNLLGFEEEGTIQSPMGFRYEFIPLFGGEWALVDFHLKQGTGNIFTAPLVVHISR